MAYNSGYNPDALPAHAEPEQAAQLLSQPQQPPPPPPPSQGRRTSAPRPHPGSQSSYNQAPPGYQNKPQPPAPPPANQWPPQQNYGQRPPHSTSPHNYSHSPPAPSQNGFRPPRPPGPPVTPAPPRAGNQSSQEATLFPLFKAVDKQGTGQLTERELRNALVNGDYTSFDPHTVKMMIRMFDTDRNGTIGFDEFCGLWAFLAAWRTLFDRFDLDRSGNISLSEFSDALTAFGYHLSTTFVGILYRTYDKGCNNALSFDLFVQACIALKRMTDVFKRYDDDRDGYITLSFEEFLTEILRQR